MTLNEMQESLLVISNAKFWLANSWLTEKSTNAKQCHLEPLAAVHWR